MTEPEEQPMLRVIVDEASMGQYAEKGYVRSVVSPKEILGWQAWSMLTEEARHRLTVMEIDKRVHDALNTAPRKHYLIRKYDEFLISARPLLVDCLQTEGYCTWIAASKEEGAPKSVESTDLHDTASACVAASKADIMQQILQHQQAQARLVALLKEHGLL